ncbi:hypothetical protein [Tumebacillus flagellatus]|uniref:Small, acid-soluble spore protein, alpha/beta type n=1 Tax=Tumebacillus flagellatus TaxID=1157490 RepID=A0A074LYU0_9BACL|nr:hypothetical protein [Tumebacillus flagellatus]KEO85198.1 hypothetical protein EL26_01170 [Tumebacillus flagellatus]
MTQNPNREVKLPDAYHPNQVDLHMDEVREKALQQLGLTNAENLTTRDAAQVGQLMAEELESLQANVNQQSE